MIPYKFNQLGVSNNKLNNISSFKIQGNSLTSMYITPVEDCVVDFGDGTKQTFTGDNSSAPVSHSYSESNIYTIKITGNHSNFRASRNIIEIIQLANSITDCSSMFQGCSSLTAIPSTLTIPNSVTNCSQMFRACRSLTAIPETLTIPNSVTNCSNMFNSCSKITAIPETLTIPNSVTNCQSMFNGCSKITAIQEGFTLGNSVTNCAYMFQNCTSLTVIPSTLTIPNSVTTCAYMFQNCTSLTSDISNIWPSAWNYTRRINLSNMFNSCSKVVGTVPADKLWSSGKTFSADYCFRSCTSLTNYAEIPEDWK